MLTLVFKTKGYGNLNFKGQEITFIYADIEFQNLYAENQLSDM